MLALEYTNVDNISLILGRGPDFERTDLVGNTAMSIIETIDLDKQQLTKILESAIISNSHIDFIRSIIEKDPSILKDKNITGSELFKTAIRNNQSFAELIRTFSPSEQRERPEQSDPSAKRTRLQ